MIIRSLLRRPIAVQSFSGAPAKCLFPQATRSYHKVPSLDNHSKLVQKGIPGLLSREAFQIAYLDYHQLLVDEMNKSTAGKTKENLDSKDLLIEFARNPVEAHAFNVASMAFNNHFFFRGIATTEDVVSAPSSDLLAAINHNFSSLDTLRAEFLATADAMFGPGFVWLVQVNEGNRPLRIMNTYLAGSPLSGAHYRRQSHDLNTHNADSYQQLNDVGSFGDAARVGKQERRESKPLGGVDIVPLMCVNTWQHVWLHDYGVRGKMKYLEAWWNKINWNTAQEGATLGPSTNRRFAYDRGQQPLRNNFLS